MRFGSFCFGRFSPPWWGGVKNSQVMSQQWGHVVKMVHIMVDQKVESKIGTRNPPFVTFFHQLGPSSFKFQFFPNSATCWGNKCSKHQPVGTFQI